MNAKRIVAVLLAVLMVVCLVPVSAMAEETSVVNGFYNGQGKWVKGGDGSQSYTDENGGKMTLSKTAEETEVPGEYKITLKAVTATQTIVAPDSAAAVLVIDCSSSMKKDAAGNDIPRGSNATPRMEAAKIAAKNFINAFKEEDTSRYIAIVPFNKDVVGTPTWYDVSTTKGYNSAISTVNNLTNDTWTNLDAALRKASDMLDNKAITYVAAKNRFTVVLSDGAPSYYMNGAGQPTKGEDERANKLEITFTTTTATAAKLREKCKLYTVCFGSLKDKTYDPDLTVDEYLRNSIATPATAEDVFAFDAADEDALYKAFGDIVDKIKKDINVGSSGEGTLVIDPMGPDISMVACPDNFVLNGEVYNWSLTGATPEVKTDGDVTTYTYTYEVSYTVKVEADKEGFDETAYHPTNLRTYLKWFGDKQYDFPVPGVKGTTSRYTVTYNCGAGTLEGQDVDGNVVHTELKKWTKTPAAPKATAPDGYYFTGWDKTIAEKVTEDVVYTATYAEKTVVNVKVEDAVKPYSGEPQTGNTTYSSDLPAGLTMTGITYTPATGTDADTYENGSFSGTPVIKESGVDVSERYTVKCTPGKLTITPIDAVVVTITGNSKEVIYDGTEQTVEGFKSVTFSNNLYTEADFVYTGSTSASGTTVGEYPMGIDESKFTNLNDNFTNVVFTVVDGGLKISPVEAPITITADGGEKIYDGTALTVSTYTFTQGVLKEGDELIAVTEGSQTNAGISQNAIKSYVVMNGEDDVTDCYTFAQTVPGTLKVNKRAASLTSATAAKTYDGQPLTASTVEQTGFVGTEGADCTVTGSQTDAGTSSNSFTYTLKSGTLADNYTITKNEGTLTVNALTGVVVTITGNSDEGTYNGKDQTVTGYTFSSNNPLFTKDEMTFDESKATITGKNADTYTGTLTAADFGSKTENFSGVSFIVNNGTLTIAPAKLTLKSADASKKYDGTALKKESVTATGFVAGEGATYSNFASLLGTGTTANTFDYTMKAGTLASNYDVTTEYGTLTVEADAKIKVEGYEGVYDGKAHDAVVSKEIINTPADTVWEYTYSVDNVNYTKTTPAVIHAGEYTIYVRGTSDQQEVRTTAVNVKVTPAPITVTPDSLIKVEGDPDPEFTYTVDGTAEGETAAFTGKLVREEGEERGEYAITQGDLALTDGDNFKASDYTLTVKTGKMTVLHPEVAITVDVDEKRTDVGKTVTITVEVTNVGEVDLPNVKVTGDTPIKIEENIELLKIGEKEVFVYQYTVKDEDEGKDIPVEFTATPEKGKPATGTTEFTVNVIPKTSDPNTVTVWAVLMGIAVAAIAVAAWRKKVWMDRNAD